MSSSGATYRGRCSEGGDNYVYDIVKDSIAVLTVIQFVLLPPEDILKKFSDKGNIRKQITQFTLSIIWYG